MFASLKSFLTTGVADPSFPFTIGEITPPPPHTHTCFLASVNSACHTMPHHATPCHIMPSAALSPLLPHELITSVLRLQVAVQRSSDCIWTIRTGKAKPENKVVSIFELAKKGASEAEVRAAQHAVKKLRTMRHPSIITYLGSTENENVILLATEAVTPLLQHLQTNAEEDELRSSVGTSWGIYQILSALAFFAESKVVHRSVCIHSIFVSADGDWKLGGFERLGPFGTAISDLPMSVPPQYACPEDSDAQKARRALAHSVDMWGYGCFLWEVLNEQRLDSAAQLKDVGKLPKALVPDYISAVSANPRSRPSPQSLIDRGREKGKYFCNSFIDANLFLSELAVKDAADVNSFYKALPEQIDSFPRTLCKTKLLPQLLNAFHFGGAGYQVLAPILKVGQFLSDEEYKVTIVPSLIDLFSSKDRATRIALLQKAGLFINYLSDKIVTKDVFPHISQGFTDTAAPVREETVKAMLLFAPKLSATILDNDLMKHFARLQVDEKPSIRTNTTICLGKIAKHLSAATRARVLVPAFTRAAKDSFAHSRSAAVMGINATISEYSPQLLAQRILPEISPLLVDTATNVRTQALKLLKTITGILEENSKKMEVEAQRRQEEEEAKRIAHAKRHASQQQQQQQQQDATAQGEQSSYVAPVSKERKSIASRLAEKPVSSASHDDGDDDDDDDEFHNCKETYHDDETSDWEDDGWEAQESAPIPERVSAPKPASKRMGLGLPTAVATTAADGWGDESDSGDDLFGSDDGNDAEKDNEGGEEWADWADDGKANKHATKTPISNNGSNGSNGDEAAARERERARAQRKKEREERLKMRSAKRGGETSSEAKKEQALGSAKVGGLGAKKKGMKLTKKPKALAGSNDTKKD